MVVPFYKGFSWRVQFSSSQVTTTSPLGKPCYRKRLGKTKVRKCEVECARFKFLMLISELIVTNFYACISLPSSEGTKTVV